VSRENSSVSKSDTFLFYAAFIPGLQNIIAEVIKERLPDAKIHKLLDGAVLFETQTSYDKLNFFCFNNIFAVINILEHTNDSIALENHLKFISNCKLQNTQSCKEYKNDIESGTLCASIVNINTIVNNNKNFITFRIVVSNENVPASIDEKLRTDTEKTISRLSGLKVNRALPDTEFWFLYRNEESSQEQSFSVFMKRLTLRASWEKTLHKGELPPPLAWTLCRLASLKHSETVLDPFCGYGSIPDSAAKHFHITDFICNDNDKKAVSYTVERFKKRKNCNFLFHNADFYDLPSIIKEKSIDAIVTDPPWGQYKGINDSGFLKKMFEVFYKLLKDGGRAVVLYSNDDNFLKAAESNFVLKKNIPILLSGRKAVIYVFVKKR